MSSESNGDKQDSHESPPPSGQGKRLSARAPSAWGAARDALAAVHNLVALLRSASVDYRTILDLLPELRTSVVALSDAFERARGEDEPTSVVGRYGGGQADELGRLLDETAAAVADRNVLADRAHSLADELEASADLLTLLERAAEPVPAEISLNVIARETGRMAGTGRGREVVVRLDEAVPDCVVTTDPYVVGPLLSLAITCVHGSGADEVVVRARCVPPHASLLVEAAADGDCTLPMITRRVLPVVPPAEPVARRAAEQIGALLVVEKMRWAIALGSASS